MEAVPSSEKQQNQRNATAALNLPQLTMAYGASIPSAPGLHKKTTTAADTADESLPGNKSSKKASVRWRPDPRAPIYQPLDIPPLGMKTHHVLTPIATEPSTANTIPYRAIVDKRPDQLNSDGYRIPSSTSKDSPQATWRISLGSSMESLAVPNPHPSYLAQSAVPTMKRATPQPLLIVLDLNGTLLYRPKASSAYKPRPSLEPFLSHCISKYKVLVWSSATPQNVTGMCSRIFTPKQRKLLIGEWARDTLDLTAKQYSSKIQVYKRLDRIWNLDWIQRTHPDFKKGQRWGQWNTLLLDDSVLKSSAQPYNAVVVPEFTMKGVTEEAGAAEVLGQVVAYLETARMYDDMSSFVRANPFQANDEWRSDWARARSLCVKKGCESDEEPGGVKIRSTG